MLTAQQRSEFRDRGVLVVPKVVSAERVEIVRAAFHATLRDRFGVDVFRLDDAESVANLGRASSTKGAGGILDLFHEPFQLGLAETPEIVRILIELWSEMRDTYSSARLTEGVDYSKALAAVDRVCFRLPDDIAAAAGGEGRKPLQRHLAPHLDCCPHASASEVPVKWRPIQCFLALTDSLTPTSGGLEVCPGHHNKFDSWAAARLPSAAGKPAPCQGEFTPMRPVEDSEVIADMVHVPCRAGDLVLWDNRIPHSNARCNSNPHAREVVYLKFLPHCDLNRRYVESQVQGLRARSPPSDFWIGAVRGDKEDQEQQQVESAQVPLQALGQRLFGLKPWEASESIADFYSTTV